MKHEMCHRGVVYITSICNSLCEFCYYQRFLKDKKHKPYEEVKSEVERQRFYYNLEATDVTGEGEPTLHPNIREIVSHCAEIGLKPTVITNGLLPGVVKELIHNGLDDLLLSIEGVEGVHDEAVGVKGAFEKVLKTINMLMLKEEVFHFRTNTVMTKTNMENLPALAEFLVQLEGLKMANFIGFNLGGSGGEWAKEVDIPFQARYSDIAPFLVKAIDTLMASGIWVNVRYFPMCILPDGYEKHIVNFHQHMYDPTEWNVCASYQLSKEQMADLAGRAKLEGFYGESDEERLLNYLVLRRELRGAVKAPCCISCVNLLICDGIAEQYARRFGFEELRPTECNVYIRDPIYYRRHCEGNK